MVQPHSCKKTYAVARRLQRHVRPRTGARPGPVPPHARWPRVRDTGQGMGRASLEGLARTVAVGCLGLSWVAVLDRRGVGRSLSWGGRCASLSWVFTVSGVLWLGCLLLSTVPVGRWPVSFLVLGVYLAPAGPNARGEPPRHE